MNASARAPLSRRTPRLVLALAGLLCAFAFSDLGAARGATVTLGPDLTTAVAVNTFSCNIPGGCTYSQESASFVSPIDGTIVRWRVLRGHGPLTLRTISGNTGGLFSTTEEPASEALETFPADIPIKAGQRVGVDLPTGFVSDVGVARPAGFSVSSWIPSLLAGEERSPNTVYNEFELLLNADVQPPPGIVSLSPTHGPVAGGSRVIISGHDFSGADAVDFGTVPAAGFSVDSDTQITATLPPGRSAGAVPLTVTTLAGTASSSFDYEAPASAPLLTTPPGTPPPPRCVVPKLKGKKLKAARRRARATACKVGEVTKKDGVTARSGVVVKQVPKPGSVIPAGGAIKVRLG